MKRDLIPARVPRSRRPKKRRLPPVLQYHLSRLEELEPRCVLASPTLAALSDVTLYAGTSLNIALDGADSDSSTLNYTVTSTNSNVAAAISNPGNRSLEIEIADVGDDIYGTIILQLFEDLTPDTTARIIQLAQSGFYDGLTFHRIIEDFMIQGGDPDGTGSGGTGSDFDDEYSPSLQFTSSGLVAMAKSNNDTNDSQFFITCGPTRWLDYHHTIFGRVTEGYDIVSQLSQISTNSSDAPINSVIMTSVSVIQDRQNGVLRISAPEGVTGTSNITVVVTDESGHQSSRTFKVTVAADTTTNSAPYLQSIAPIVTTIDAPVTFTLPGVDPDGDAMVYSAAVDSTNSDNGSKISVSVNSATGQVTITPASGVYGVYSILVKVADTTANLSATSSYKYDSQIVPVYITPAAPVIERLLPAYDTGSSDSDSVTNLDNSSPSHTLTFRLSGLMTGAQVKIYADGQVIGTALATAGTMDIPTNGALDLADGTHAIRAVQTLANQTVDVGNLSTTADLDSPSSNSLVLRIDTGSPQYLSTAVTRAGIGATYTYDVRTDDEEGNGATYELLDAPSGMTIDPQTGVIQWAPTADQEGSHAVVVKATDAAGNVSQQMFTVKAATGPVFDAIAKQFADQGSLFQVTLAASGDNTPLTYSLGSDAPQSATINATTGVFQWTPSADDAGETHTVTVYVTDAAGLTDETELQIVVRKVVTLVAAPGTSLSQSMATSDSSLEGETVAYSLQGTAPDGMTIDQATGLVIWNVPSGQSAGTVRVVVRATAASDESLYSEEVLNITIAHLPELLPLDNSTVVAASSGLSFRVQATADTAVTFSLVGSYPSGLSVNPVTGVVTWNAAAQATGQFSFTIRAQDSFGRTDEATYTFAWQSALPNSTVNVSLQSNDPALAGKTIQYAIVGDAPDGLTVDSQTGQVTWTVPANFQVSGGTTKSVVVVVRATASQAGVTAFSDQILQVNVSTLAPVVSAVLGRLDLNSPRASALIRTAPTSPSAPVDVAASVTAFAQESDDLLGPPLGESVSPLAGDAVPTSPLGLDGSDLFGHSFSEVTTHGDTSSGRITPRPKDWEEVAPKKRLEENAAPDRQAAAPQNQPDETQQAERKKRRDLPPIQPDQTQQAERDSARRDIAPEAVDAAAVDAVVQAISEDAASEGDVVAAAPADEAQPEA